MKVLIIGAGLVGSSLGEALRANGHDIVIIESNAPRCAAITDSMDVMTILGSGSNPQDLERAGITSADMVIAATPIDEVNLVCCSIAERYKVPHRLARIRTDIFNGEKLRPGDFGITQVIYPEQSTIEAVLNIVETPQAIDVQDFQQRSVLLRSFMLTASMPIVGRTLAELRSLPAGRMLLVVAILRGDEVIIPRGDSMLRPGDKPLCIFPRADRNEILSLFGIDAAAKRRVIVYGDTLTAVNIAQALESEVDRVIFIDPNAAHADAAAAKLRKSDVLHGDANDHDVLLEANVRYADFFIAATEYNDRNILSCLLAKSEGAKEVVAVLTDEKHMELFRSIGINHVINPRQLTAVGILNAVLPGFVTTSLHIQKTDIDVLRLPVRDKTDVAHRPLMDSWKSAVGTSIVGAIIRNGEMLVPRGDTVLLPDDLVLVFTRTSGIRKVRKMFGVTQTYLNVHHA